MLYGILFLILTFWPKISCKKMIMIFYHESIIHENIFFVFSFTSFQTERLRELIPAIPGSQCCLTEDNYPACIRSCVEGQSGEWGVTTSEGIPRGERGPNMALSDPSDAVISWHLDNNLGLLVLLRSQIRMRTFIRWAQTHWLTGFSV